MPLNVPNVAGLLAWLHGDALKKKIADHIRANAPADGIAAADRAKRLKELDALILGLQRREQAIIELIEGDGGEVLRVAEAVDYRAVLGLADSMPAPRGDH